MRRVLFPLCLPLVACGVEKISGDEGGACVPEPVQAAFTAHCANMPACHGDSPTTQVAINLTPAGSRAIVGQKATQSSLPLVELGSVENSYLAHKILDEPPVAITGERMPSSGVSFDDPALQADMAIIIGWIGGADLGECAGGTDTNAEASGSGSESSTGPQPIKLCGIEDVKPGAPNPVVSGDAAMQIPTEIGDILVGNCGCHYAMNPLEGGAVAYPPTGPFQISTWDEWQGMVNDNLTVIQSALNRVDFESENLMMFPGVVMPQPTYCHTGDGETMPLAERATLVEWLRAGAPDGASWPP